MEAEEKEKEYLRQMIVKKLQAGDVEGINQFVRALKGETRICRNFFDLLKVCSQKDAPDQHRNEPHEMLQCVWIPDEKGESFERYLRALTQQ